MHKNYDDSLWGVAPSIEEANISLVKYKRSLYHRIQVDDNNVKSPLQWWKNHAKYFPNVTILAHQFMGTPSYHIE
jgi:hypothetical protein